MITPPLLSNEHNRAMMTPVSSFVLARAVGQFIVRLKLISKWELFLGLDLKSSIPYKSIASTFSPI